jgi:hypothetical protein
MPRDRAHVIARMIIRDFSICGENVAKDFIE